MICAKGIERASTRFLTDVLAEAMPDVVPAVLSGPSFAADVARGLPTAVTVAAREDSVAQAIAGRLATSAFRPYRSTDMRGAEIGGAAKNVLAIACGIAKGAGLGASAGAALIARGFAELARFGCALDARPETLMGLSGLGDLVLTCSSEQSRNFSFGLALGRGETTNAAAHGQLVEGAFTASVLVELARSVAIDMPISECVARVVAGELQIMQAVEALLQRPPNRNRRGHDMTHWLIKTEPSSWSWEQQVAADAKGTEWSGVRNHLAKKHLQEMKVGDEAFFYHSGEQKAVVGIVDITKAYHPDPTDKTGVFGMVDVKALKPLGRPVTLGEIKADTRLKDMVLVKSSRLSVQPVTEAEWRAVLALANV